jgi:hypothetical protein
MFCIESQFLFSIALLSYKEKLCTVIELADVHKAVIFFLYWAT